MEGIGKVSTSLLDQLNPEKTTKPEDTQQTFLKLLTAQLKNQDPLQPTQSGEFLSQIAQFTTATGISDLKTSFSDLSGVLTSNMALQASSLVGREVLLDSPTAKLKDGHQVEGIIELPQSTTSLQLRVYDASGALVRTIPMGMQTQGYTAFQWDGTDDSGSRLPSGTYSMEGEATFDGQPAAVAPLVYARVESVSMNGAGRGVMLNVDGLGPRSMSQVKQVK